MEIKEARLSEVKEIVDLHHKCLKQGYAYHLGKPIARLIYYVLLLQRYCIVIVAKEKGKIVGVAASIKYINELFYIFVDNKQRRKGIASKLVSASLGWFVFKKVKMVKIHFNESNKRAKKFYKSFGFVCDNKSGCMELI